MILPTGREVVSSKVGEAIADLQIRYRDREIIKNMFRNVDRRVKDPSINVLADVYLEDPDFLIVLMRALDNGFKIEDTPEERARDLYDHLLKSYRARENRIKQNID